MDKQKLETYSEIYRSTKFDQMIDVGGQIKQIDYILNRRIKQNLLFVGPAGTGKTTVAWIAARKFINLNMSEAAKKMISNINEQIEYINASDTGIDDIRKKVKPLVSVSGPNVIILDEFDGITKASQNALRPIMESAEQMKSPKLFILTVNDISLVIDPIISRCGATYYIFPKIPYPLMKPKLIEICRKEKVEEFKFPPEVTTKEQEKKALDLFFKSLYIQVDGDMRKALKYLQIKIEAEAGKNSLDISSPIVDLTTNPFDIQMDKILLSKEEINFVGLIESVDELIYKKEGKSWDRSSFFKEAFLWIKDRNNRFSNILAENLAAKVAYFEDVMAESKGNTLHIQLFVMIAQMRRMILDEELDKRTNN